jgi:hypothetical protein
MFSVLLFFFPFFLVTLSLVLQLFLISLTLVLPFFLVTLAIISELFSSLLAGPEVAPTVMIPVLAIDTILPVTV